MRELFQQWFGSRPPIPGVEDWGECVEGELELFFELRMPAPRAYKCWLSLNVGSRQFIPYVLAAASSRDQHAFRTDLEGATKVDALLLNTSSGFAVVFE